MRIPKTKGVGLHSVGGYGAAPPNNTVLPVVSGSAVTNQTLSTTNGTWGGNPTSYTYLWKHGDGSAAAAAATASTYVVATGDIGFTMVCQVTATGAGSTAATSAATSTVTAQVALSGNPSVDTTGLIVTCTTNVAATHSGVPTLTIAGSTPVLAYKDGDGTTSIRYDITNGNPSGNPVLAFQPLGNPHEQCPAMILSDIGSLYALPVRNVRRSIAHKTAARPAVVVHPNIQPRQRMPSLAMRLLRVSSAGAITPHNIHGQSYRLKVRGVDAVPYSTQVVNGQPFFY